MKSLSTNDALDGSSVGFLRVSDWPKRVGFHSLSWWPHGCYSLIWSKGSPCRRNACFTRLPPASYQSSQASWCCNCEGCSASSISWNRRHRRFRCRQRRRSSAPVSSPPSVPRDHLDFTLLHDQRVWVSSVGHEVLELSQRWLRRSCESSFQYRKS